MLVKEKGIHFYVLNDLKSCQPGFTYAINVDVMRLEQAILCLLSNSIKFTPPEGSISIVLKHRMTEKITTNISVASGEEFGSKNLPPNSLRFWSSEDIHSKSVYKVHCKPAHAPQFEDTASPNQCETAAPKKTNNDEDQYLKSREREEQAIVIEIKDTGSGIKQEHLEKVFGSGQFNAHALQGGGGNGLGLWICKEIIKQHRGNITISSEGEGYGTTISLTFSCYINESEKRKDSLKSSKIPNRAAFPPTPPDRNTSALKTDHVIRLNVSEMKEEKAGKNIQFNASEMKAEKAGENINILVVDDSSLNRKVLMRMLQQMQAKFYQNHSVNICFNFKEADDGVTAIQELIQCNNRFDIVFLDNIMLNMNGPETAQRMRQEHNFCGTIIGVTGNVLEVDIADFLHHGADKIFPKPISSELLTEFLSTLLIC